MQEKFDAIILKVRTYSDSSLIIKTYTKENGVESFIARGVKKKKKNSNIGLYQILSHVEIVSYSKSKNAELKNLKEIKANYHYTSLYYDIYKSGIIQFLTEVLDMVLKEEEENVMLFEFLKTSFHYLDELESYSNFHIVFLLELSKHLGFYPNIEDDNSDYFDLERGVFLNFNNNSPYIIHGESVLILKQFLGTKFVESSGVSMSRNKRISILKILMEYYKLHISNFRNPKSLEILESLYN